MKLVSTGISISSINRIKELAEEKKYAEALEILDTQNLDKSINPQFLRISGIIFRENKRYYDSRRILIKSHEMSPQGTRIIAEIIELYLELGYFTRAEKYYEQYLFYSTEDDLQRDYVEYAMKKAKGGDIKELASILIPILDNFPDEKWNFEAILLYDKLDRKDRALEEAQFILENFKESDYIKSSIEYINGELDVDEYFYIYPKEEVQEDVELYGELIEKEDKILEADYLRMYPPEPKIIVEVEDNDADNVKTVKDKKQKKKRSANKKSVVSVDETESSGNQENIDSKGDTSKRSELDDNSIKQRGSENKENTSMEIPSESVNGNPDKEDTAERIKKEREAALDKLLSKKLDKDAIVESARQMAKNVGNDTKKTREHVKKATESVIDNVHKATDTLSGAVGTSKVTENNNQDDKEEFVDGIIESVLEAPKKPVGQVIINEELDALIPESLEAISPDEAKKLETKREEQEQLELEALEASVLLEEKKKNRKKLFDFDNKYSDNDSEENMAPEESEDVIVVDTNISNEPIVSISFAELKQRFLEDNNDNDDDEEQPLETLGFMSVVQSDVDEQLENAAPDTANILHRMIDNKEYYTGEDSRGFESKASYENHGFEVDDFEINDYIALNNEIDNVDDTTDNKDKSELDNIYKVEGIFSQESVVEFDDIAPDIYNDVVFKEPEVKENEPETFVEEKAEISEEEKEAEPETFVEEKAEIPKEEKEAEPETFVEEKAEIPEEEKEAEPDIFVEEKAELHDEEESDNIVQRVGKNATEKENGLNYSHRDMLRYRIILTDEMVKELIELKESR